MKTPLFLAILWIASFSACKKTDPIPNDGPGFSNQTGKDSSGFYGVWTWSNSVAGPWQTIPPADSVVTLTLNSDNSYSTAINDKIFSTGTFTITGNSSNPGTVHFNNIPSTSYTAQPNGANLIQYGYTQIGELLLFVDDEVELQGDSLQLLRIPVSPEDYNGHFKK